MDKSLLGILGLVLFIVSVSAIFSTQVNVINPSGKGLKYGSNVCVHKNGELVQCGPNTLTNAGMNFIEDQLISSTVSNISFIALCNTSNVSTDGGGDGCKQVTTASTVLNGEYQTCGLERAQGTYASEGTGNFSYAYTFTSGCNNLVTNGTGLFNDTNGISGILFAANNFTSVTLQTNDQLTVTWYVWVT